MKGTIGKFLCLSAVVVSTAVHAHHSRSEYAPTPTRITGTVDSVSWRNPHIEVRMTTTAGEQWILESSSATVMNTAGIKSDILQKGMQVSAAGGASLRRSQHMLVSNFLLPDSKELVMMINSPRQWDGNEVIGVGMGSQRVALPGRLPEDGRGLFRAWTFIPVDGQFWMTQTPDKYPLTPKARAAADKWDVYDPAVNHVLRCIPPGMPATMGSPHPMELVDKGADIELHNEEFDIVRTIHMNIDPAPQDEPYSPLGYSVGHWEGDTLVVNTNRIDTPYFNRAGVPLSRNAEVEERFTANADKGQLDYVLTVTDPQNLTEPFVQPLTWFWNASTSVQRYDCDARE